MPNHLRPVEPEPTPIITPPLHPWLKDVQADPIVVHDPGSEYPTYSVDFDKTFDGPEILALLSAPMQGIVSHFDAQDVRKGVRSLTYPNSRVMKGAKAIDREARARIVGQGAEILGLLDVIDHPRNHQMVPAKVHVLGLDLAELVVRDELGRMKPSALSKLCDEWHIPHDELRIRRLKGPDRINRTVRLDALGIDTDAIITKLKKETYLPKIALPTYEDAMVPKAELPKDKWAQDTPYIELLRRLPRLAGEDIDRWRVLLRRDDTARHVVRPLIAWTTEVRPHPNFPDAQTKRPRFVTSYKPPIYHLKTNTVEHTSPILGAVMLAAQVPVSQRYVFNNRLAALLFRKGHMYQDRPVYDPKAAGIFLALLQSKWVTETIMSTPAFARLQRFAAKNAHEADPAH